MEWNFLFLIFFFAFFFLTNTVLLEIWDGALNSTYISSTMYTSCVTALTLSSVNGIILGAIHLVPYSAVKSCCSRRRKEETETEESIIRRLLARITSSSRMVTHSENTTDGFAQVETPTTIGITAVSIPPGSEQQRAHFRANQAYTTNLLQHVKDKLDEEEDTSFIESTIISNDSEVSI